MALVTCGQLISRARVVARALTTTPPHHNVGDMLHLYTPILLYNQPLMMVVMLRTTLEDALYRVHDGILLFNHP